MIAFYCGEVHVMDLANHDTGKQWDDVVTGRL